MRETILKFDIIVSGLRFEMLPGLVIALEFQSKRL
jgi:hypothetical protein